MSVDDLKKMERGEESQLAITLRKVEDRCRMVWVALSTSSLLETIMPGHTALVSPVLSSAWIYPATA